MRHPNFSTIVKRWRKARGFTKVAAADHLDVPYRTFQNWELGIRTPRGINRRLLERRLQ